MNKINFPETRAKLATIKSRSKAVRANKGNALEFLDFLENETNVKEFENTKDVEKCLLNGAANWRRYSNGGCALIFDSDIIEKYCTSSIISKYKNGVSVLPNSETWLDVQARFLCQSWHLLAGCLVFES